MKTINLGNRPLGFYDSVSIYTSVNVDWTDAIDEVEYEHVMHYLHDGQSPSDLIDWLKALPQEFKQEIVKELAEAKAEITSYHNAIEMTVKVVEEHREELEQA